MRQNGLIVIANNDCMRKHYMTKTKAVNNDKCVYVHIRHST